MPKIPEWLDRALGFVAGVMIGHLTLVLFGGCHDDNAVGLILGCCVFAFINRKHIR